MSARPVELDEGAEEPGVGTRPVEMTRFITSRRRRSVAFGSVAALVALALAIAVAGPAQLTQAALIEGSIFPDVLVGRDDDNQENPIIQPEGAVNQSLNNTDVLEGEFSNNVLIGLLGSDVMRASFGDDILVGGTEQGTPPNSDIMFGDFGHDVSIWAPGDGSEAFMGGPGIDAEVFGVIDRDENNVPTLTGQARGFPNGIPTADLTGSPGFCTVERVADPSLGYEFLVRFFVRATGNLAVTVRPADVEQAFCTSEAGGAITFADLTQENPEFVEVSVDDVEQLNPLVAAIIR